MQQLLSLIRPPLLNRNVVFLLHIYLFLLLLSVTCHHDVCHQNLIVRNSWTLCYDLTICRFHVLSDFDDEKRSCRRKLERHNNRRRRKVQESGDDTATLTIDNDNPSPDEGLYFIVFISTFSKHRIRHHFTS